jgi:hypothetical protein
VKSPLQRLNEIVAQTFRDLTIEEMSQQHSADLAAGLSTEPRLVTISAFVPDV